MNSQQEREVQSVIKGIQEKMISEMMSQISLLTDIQRVELLAKFSNSFCRGCGRNDPRCQCENEE